MATPDLQALLSALAKPHNASAKLSETSRIPSALQTNGAGHQASTTSSYPHGVVKPRMSQSTKDDSPQVAPPNSFPQSEASINNDRVQSLLSMLNFGQVNATLESSSRAADPKFTSMATQSPTDLVARSMAHPDSKAGQSRPQATAIVGTSENSDDAEKKPHSESQDALLRLLSQPCSNSAGTPEPEASSPGHQITGALECSTIQQDPAKVPNIGSDIGGEGKTEHQPPSIRLFGTHTGRETTPFEPLSSDVSPAKKQNPLLFTYRNPFEALNASRQQTQKSQTALPKSSTAPANIDITESGVSSPVAGPEKRTSSDGSLGPNPLRRKLTLKASTLVSLPDPPAAPAESLVTDHTPTDQLDVEIKNKEPGTAGCLNAVHDTPIEVPRTVHEEQDVRAQTSNAIHEPENETNHAEPADIWESAEDSPGNQFPERQVPVYNFPIKPFISVTLQPGPSSRVQVREDGVMEISRLKKEFDHMDRSLAAATSKYISYALVKSGGLRIIRQDDGSDRQVFKNSRDRIFNVAFCTTAASGPPTDRQAVLGTGISGSVYYAPLFKEGLDLFEENLLDFESLVFAPYPAGDENTSGGVLRTRAKRSSRHPEYFAIGRGKNIYIIWPATATSPTYGIQGKARNVDIEKFYQEHGLKISTGKAGKDFTFSEDDTVIASLDKAGRLRFWDIRPLVDEVNANVDVVSTLDVDTPLLSLSTASAAEKSWPTSVLFVDKIRPYLKGSALRYNLVGLKQNHTLQLWDIALGKAVQELNFPHEAETDAICSINYHPASGVIVVGHPTRNSIYLIHLSAPKYILPHMSQAAYIRRLANKDPELPRPESTAVMSGIREISFETKGQLRSAELLPVHRNSDVSKSNPDALPLFELYVVHSKGVTCLSITKEDLGWSTENTVLNPINAVDAGIVTLKELRLGSIINENLDSKAEDDEQTSTSKITKKKVALKKTESGTLGPATQPHSGAVQPQFPKAEVETASQEAKISKPNDITDSQKPSKKAKKKSTPSTQTAFTKDVLIDDGPAHKQAHSKSKSSDRESEVPASQSKHIVAPPQTSANECVSSDQPESTRLDMSGDWLDKELKKIEKWVSLEFRKELDKLYHNIQNDRNIQDSASVARHEAVLRLVSSMLSTNVENSLSRIVETQIQQVVVPSIHSATVPAIVGQVVENVAKTLHQLMLHELTTCVPPMVNAALQSTQLTRNMTEMVSQKLANQVEMQFSALLQSSIIPSFTNLVVSTAKQATTEVEGHLGTRIRQLENERRHDSNKIDQLNQILHGMAETMQAMSDSQVAFQDQILKDRRQVDQIPEAGFETANQQVPTVIKMHSVLSDPAPAVGKSAQDIEIDEVSEMMAQGKYEDGTIKWLQSAFQIELFDNLFVRYTPDYLASDVSPLVAFSVAITVANSLQTYTTRRLQWIDAAFDAVDFEDPELADLSRHAPALLDSLIQKLETKYVTTAQYNPTDPVLQLIPPITHKARERKRAAIVRT